MRWRGLALLSVGLNLALALWWLFSLSGSRYASGSTGTQVLASLAQTKTNTVVRRQFFSWQEVESQDYPTYIANLRDIGCPEQTIRDIIIADVNALYARRRATELVTPEQQWWRSEPDADILQAALEKLRGLESERRGLLTRLLGTNWETGDLVSLPRPSRQGVLLDGPVLGTLPLETKQAIEDVNTRSEDRLQAYLERVRQEGKTADPVELAKIRQQTRVELEHILSPAQLEEYLLRYSQNADDLRAQFGQLGFFNPTPEEFRQVFRARDYLDQKIQLLADSIDPNSAAQRKALEDQRESAIKVALGPKRYAEYQLLQDPLYRDAVATALDSGTPEAAQTLYQVNLAAAQEQARINSSTNLTAGQKLIQQKQAELDQLKANALATGQELPPGVTQSIIPPPPVPNKVHVFAPGDSLTLVSLLYGVPIRDLQAANPDLDFNRLRPGDSLTIPRTGYTPSAPPLPIPYR